jgi:hypothetical protein
MWTKTEMRLGLASQCCESVHSRGIGLWITTDVQCKEGLVQEVTLTYMLLHYTACEIRTHTCM